MNPSDPTGSGWTCPRRAGFLFPHECQRISPIGCPDCGNGQINDPYAQRTDRYGYSDYDDYPGVGGSNDFTEADGEKLVKPRKQYEDDMTAS